MTKLDMTVFILWSRIVSLVKLGLHNIILLFLYYQYKVLCKLYKSDIVFRIMISEYVMLYMLCNIALH